MNDQPRLKRSLSLFLTTSYGLGTILGAGIYVLIGKVAGAAGMLAPWAFAVALILASFSAFSYAELASRFPQSSGEAIYIQQGLGQKFFSILVGLLICLAGIVSTATLVHGFVGYLQEFIQINDWIVIVTVILTLGGLAAWGIKESVSVATAVTLIEIAGLLIILWVGQDALALLPTRWPEVVPQANWSQWSGIFLGGFIAFYAFIGFEDMVNVAEEVINPQKNLPLAIIMALGSATLLYMSVSLVSVLAVEPEQLSQQTAPLAYVYSQATQSTPQLISLIGLFAVINGALIQMIMVSRILYGMSSQKWIAPIFSQLHPKTQTPLVATGVVIAVVLIFTLALPILTLAKATSFFTLLVFILINISLCRIKQKHPTPKGVFSIPIWVPWVGLVLSSAFLILQGVPLILKSG